MIGTSPGPTSAYVYRYRGAASTGPPPQCIALAAEHFARFAAQRQADIAAHNQSECNVALKVPGKFQAENMWSFAYREEHKLAFHVDNPGDDFVFIFNLGRTVTFTLFEHRSVDSHRADRLYLGAQPPAHARTHTVTIRSGDAVFFNGCALYHAVTAVLDLGVDDPVAQLCREHGCVRIGLQMREAATRV